jgi:hypothetical protein
MSWHFDDLDADVEFDASDDFRQPVFALQPSPGFGAAVTSLNIINFAVVADSAPL